MICSNRPWRSAVALTAASLVLTACGGADGSRGPESRASEAPEASTQGDGVLRVGTLLPQTGDLAFLGPPEFAGVDLAIEDINAAGGVLGQPVEGIRGDSGDGTPDIAGAEVDKLLDAKSDVIIGAAASGVSVSVIDKITGAGVVHFSPANTAAGFDTYDDNGLYFRTSPSDVLQGEIMANLVVGDGHQNVAILGRQDFYGEGLAKRTREVLEDKGANVAEFVLYAADAQNYTAEVAKVAAAKPDALVLIAFNETTKIVPQLIAKGIGPQDIQVYFTDGNLTTYEGEKFDLTGVKATAPTAAEPNDELIRRLKSKPGVTDLTYGAEAYDATVITALAAIAAKSDAGEAIGSAIVEVTRDGTECGSFQECKRLLGEGKDIDYEGASGPTDMTDSGSLTAGTYGVQQYDKGNTYQQIDTVSGLVPQSN